MMRDPAERAARELLRQKAKERKDVRPQVEREAFRPSGEPMVIPPRPAVTRADREAVWARDKGQCSYPECETTEGLEIDHIVPRALGGRDRADNYQLRCGPHHSAKTKIDRRMIDKAVRQGKKHRGEIKPKGTIRSQGFAPGYRAMASRGFR